MTYTDAFAFTLAGVAGIAPLQDSPNYPTIGHSAADTLDKVQAGVLEQDSALLAMSAVWLANEQARASVLFPPEKTAESLRTQETTLRLLGFWPF